MIEITVLRLLKEALLSATVAHKPDGLSYTSEQQSIMKQITMNPLFPDPREGRELSNAEFLTMLRSNNPFVSIMNLGKGGLSKSHIDATIDAMKYNTAVMHINLNVCDDISIDQLKRLALVLPPDVDLGWEPDSIDKVKDLMQILTNQELSTPHEHKKVQSLQVGTIQDMELAYAVRDYLSSNKSLRAFAFNQNDFNVVSELLQGVLSSNIESLSMFSLRLESLYIFAEIFWPYQHLRELMVGMVDGAPSLYVLGQALEYAQYTLEKLDITLMSVIIDPEEFHEFSAKLPTCCQMLTILEFCADLRLLTESSLSSFSQMCQDLPRLKNLRLRDFGSDSRILEVSKPALCKLDRLDLDIGSNQEESAIFSSALADCSDLKSLQLSRYNEDVLVVFLRDLPHTLGSLQELVLLGNGECSSGVETQLLAAVRNLHCLKSVKFPSQGIPSFEANEINHICMIRSLGRDESLMNLPLGLYPRVIEKLDHGKWISIVHHIVCERHDELVGARKLSI